MEKLVLLFTIFFFCCLTNIVAQGPPPPPPVASRTIHFSYDNAGNQIKRYFATSKSANQIAEVTETLVEELEEKQEDISLLDYYPNPIENELTITWAKSINTHVTSVFVFNISGKLVKSFNPSQKSQELNLPFQNIAGGVYIIKVLFNDGKQDIFKVIKK